ncbi:MAG TPA: hypothetical protein VGQ15_02145 [Gaiellaceae bacterium]|nr:hypothetical protein [Gaiellaceae bacterium]
MRGVRASVALLVLLLLAGCAGAEQSAQPSDPQSPGVDRTAAAQAFLSASLAGKSPVREAAVPEGFRLRQSRSDNVALAFPHGWQALTSSDARYPGVMQMFGRLNRGLASSVAALSMPDGPLKLLGFDPRTLHGFATTASVMVVRANPEAPYASWSAEVTRYTRRLPSVLGRVRARKVDHPLGAALRLDYVKRYGSGPRIRTVQFFVNSGETGYIVTYATHPKLMKRYARQFEASARTLRQADQA